MRCLWNASYCANCAVIQCPFNNSPSIFNPEQERNEETLQSMEGEGRRLTAGAATVLHHGGPAAPFAIGSPSYSHTGAALGRGHGKIRNLLCETVSIESFCLL